MVSSQLNKAALVLGTKNRSKLFYKKFRYRAKIACKGLHLTIFAKTSDHLHTQIISRFSVYGSLSTIPDGNSVEANTLKQFIDWRNLNKDKILVRVEMVSGAVFSNDLDLLKTLTSIFDSVEISEALVTENPEVVTLNDPKHKFRVYLKNKIASPNLYNDFSEFFALHSVSVFPCNALKQWVERNKVPHTGYSWNLKWLSSSHFIEYDDESTYTLLSLFFDQYLRKNYKVVKR